MHGNACISLQSESKQLSREPITTHQRLVWSTADFLNCPWELSQSPKVLSRMLANPSAPPQEQRQALDLCTLHPPVPQGTLPSLCMCLSV